MKRACSARPGKEFQMLKNKKTLIISIAAGAIATIVFFVYSSGLLNMFSGGAKKQEKKPALEMRQYVVAAVDMDIRTLVTPEMLTMAEAPMEYVHPGAVSSVDSAAGRVTQDRILAGEPVLERNLRSKNSPSELSFVVPEGKRAITVGATVTSAVGNMLEPGDAVDVVVYFDEKIAGESMSFMLLRNMLVLATDADIYGNEEKESAVKKAGKEAEKGLEYKSVTISATPEECVKLSLAESIGVIKLALHSGDDEESGEIEIAALQDMLDSLHKKEETKPTPPPTTAPAPKTSAKTKSASKSATNVEIKKTESAPVAAVFVPEPKVEPRLVQVMRGLEVETLEFDEEEQK